MKRPQATILKTSYCSSLGGGIANVTDRDCRGCRARFFNCQKNCQGSHSADGKPNMTARNRPSQKKEAARSAAVYGPDALRRIAFYCGLTRRARSHDTMIAFAWEAFF